MTKTSYVIFNRTQGRTDNEKVKELLLVSDFLKNTDVSSSLIYCLGIDALQNSGYYSNLSEYLSLSRQLDAIYIVDEAVTFFYLVKSLEKVVDEVVVIDCSYGNALKNRMEKGMRLSKNESGEYLVSFDEMMKINPTEYNMRMEKKFPYVDHILLSSLFNHTKLFEEFKDVYRAVDKEFVRLINDYVNVSNETKENIEKERKWTL